MTDYYSILYPAVVALDATERQKRAAIYDRARQIISDRGKVAANTLTTPDLLKEIHSLEAAIRRIESELSHPSAIATTETPSQVPQPLGGTQSQQRSRLRLIVGLAIPALIVGSISLGGAAVFRHWAEMDSERSRLTQSSLAPRQLAKNEAFPPEDLPYTLRRQLVYYRTTHPLGTVVISKSQKFLYLVRPNVAALRYSIGIARKCADTAGLYRISAKEKWSGYHDATRNSAAPHSSGGQAENPLGAGVLHLESENHRIHGTSKSIGFGSA